jgi:hypothetical protein
MKSVLLNLLTILIVASSISCHIEYDQPLFETLENSFSPLPQIGLTPLSTSQSKRSEKIFIPLIDVYEFAFSKKLEFENLTFLYYQPLYSLIRIKDYFLLI